jgi:hypothetical protein
MIIPDGFAGITIPLVHSSFARAAAITLGVDLASFTGDAIDVAQAVQDAADDHLAARLDTEVTIGPVTAYANFGGGPLPGTAATTSSGALDFASPPPNVAVLVKKNTATPGREGRGRFFLPWAIAKNSIDELGGLDGTQRSNIEADMNAWRDDLVAADLPVVVLHNSTSVPSLLTTFSVDSRVATQRKRLDR